MESCFKLYNWGFYQDGGDDHWRMTITFREWRAPGAPYIEENSVWFDSLMWEKVGHRWDQMVFSSKFISWLIPSALGLPYTCCGLETILELENRQKHKEWLEDVGKLKILGAWPRELFGIVLAYLHYLSDPP